MSANISWNSPDIVRDGLVLYLDAGTSNSYNRYSSAGIWRDVNGNNVTGSLINGSNFNTDNLGNIQFDGTDDVVLLPNIGVSNLSAFSVSFWARTTVGVNFPIVYSENTPSSWPSNLFIIYFGDTSSNGQAVGGLRVWFFSINVLRGVTDVRNLGWKYVTYIQTSTSSRKLYLDTILEASNTTNNTSLATHASIGAGNNNGTYQQFFNGNLALLTCYNRALTESEMIQNYNATKGRFGL
jgi:hypothetical protein